MGDDVIWKGFHKMAKIYFMRHGYAEPGTGKADAERELIPEGVVRVQMAAQVLRRMGIAPSAIYSSPRVRAVQTAERVAAALGMTITVREEVNFDFDAQVVQDFLHDPTTGDLMFVGHEPTLTQAIFKIARAEVVMKPGTVACVEVSSKRKLRGELLWLIPPDVFVSLVEDDD